MVSINFRTRGNCKTFQAIARSGKGLGKNFVTSLESKDPIISLLGGKPFPGTLFVQLNKIINLKGYPYSEKIELPVMISTAELEGLKVVVKWTKEYPRNLQVMSLVNLRSELKLLDGQKVQIKFDSFDLRSPTIETYWKGLRQTLKETLLADYLRRIKKRVPFTP